MIDTKTKKKEIRTVENRGTSSQFSKSHDLSYIGRRAHNFSKSQNIYDDSHHCLYIEDELGIFPRPREYTMTTPLYTEVELEIIL